MAKNILLFIFSIGLSATLFCGGALFASAAETSSANSVNAGNAPSADAAFGALENLSSGIDSVLGAAGEASGAGLSLAAKFFGSSGDFFQTISSHIGNAFTTLPQTSATAWQWLADFVMTYGWMFAGVIGLLVAGFLVFKLLQLSFLRHFLVRAILGVMVIIALIFGVRYFINFVKTNLASYEPTSPPAAEIATQAADAYRAIKEAVGQLGQTSAPASSGIDWQTDPNNCGQPGNVCPFYECGPYVDAYGCANGACRVCQTDCTVAKAKACKERTAFCAKDCSDRTAFCHDKTDDTWHCQYYDGLPQLSSFNVAPLESGNAFQVSWTVAGDPPLKNVSGFELWRRPDKGYWQKVPSQINFAARSFIDHPPGCGVYWYGLHIANGSGNAHGTERTSGLAPLKAQKLCDAPVITGFSAAPAKTAREFTISWTMAQAEETKVNRFELWRRQFNGAWENVNPRIPSTARSVVDQPAAVDSYQYGLHAVSADAVHYWTENDFGFRPATVAKAASLDLSFHANFAEGVYAVFQDGGMWAQKTDRIYGGGIGTYTTKGGYDVATTALTAYGHYRYYNLGDNEESKIPTLTPYASVGVQALWLMGTSGGIYGECGGDEQNWTDGQLQDYFKGLIKIDDPVTFRAGTGYYHLNNPDGTVTPFSDVNFPAAKQLFIKNSEARWQHGGRPFMEWETPPYYLGSIQHKNFGYTEAIRWTGDDYLRFVNNAYKISDATLGDFVGRNGHACGRGDDFLQTVGRNTRLPFCPSAELLAAFDETARNNDFNVIRVDYFEETPALPSRCANNLPLIKAPHPYPETTTSYDEETKINGGYASPDTTCFYEIYMLKGHGMITRFSGDQKYTPLAVDIGTNAVMNFMLNQPVKGLGDKIYVLESDGYGLYKAWIDAAEYAGRGGKYIPISDAILNQIPEW